MADNRQGEQPYHVPSGLDLPQLDVAISPQHLAAQGMVEALWAAQQPTRVMSDAEALAGQFRENDPYATRVSDPIASDMREHSAHHEPSGMTFRAVLQVEGMSFPYTITKDSLEDLDLAVAQFIHANHSCTLVSVTKQPKYPPQNR